MAQTVLVTGGTGFIGGWCIVKLLERGYVVRATVREPSKADAVRAAIAKTGQPGDGLTCFVADLTEPGMGRRHGGLRLRASRRVPPWTAEPEWSGCSRPRWHPPSPSRRDERRRQRVVMTSAAAAARPPHNAKRISDETVWADPDDPQFDSYRRSKILAERAAWDFAGEDDGTTLTTILPGAVFGPVLTTERLGSVQIIQRLLDGKPAGIPRLGFWVVDVRDLADAHIEAMTLPDAAGERFIVAGEFMWMGDIAQALRSGLGERAAKVPTRRLPDTLVRLLSVFRPELRMITGDLGRKNMLTSEKARRVLGFSPRPAATTVVDCAESLLDR